MRTCLATSAMFPRGADEEPRPPRQRRADARAGEVVAGNAGRGGRRSEPCLLSVMDYPRR